MKIFQHKKISSLYLFLDIDGVLNNSRSWNTKYYIDETCIKVLSELSKEYDLKIVLTSTWRFGFDKINHHHSINVQNLIEKLQKYDLSIYDITPQHCSNDRSFEIEHYIKYNNVKDYIILDDDLSLFSNKNLNKYLVDYRTGLTAKDIRLIKKKLK